MTGRPEVGDRVKVTGTMVDDPSPIEIGTTGTVTRVWYPGESVEQVSVEWDNGRKLMLIPIDYEVIEVIK